MKRRGLLLVAIVGLLASAVGSQDRSPADSPPKNETSPDLQFTEDGTDMLVRLLIDGPANRQVVLREFSIYDGTAPWDQPPIGVAKPRQRPQITLRYLVLVNTDLPGFVDRNLLNVPTPPDERLKQRQEVVWRLPNFRQWGFRKDEATIKVEATKFETSAQELRQVIPKLQQTIADVDKRPEANNKQPLP